MSDYDVAVVGYGPTSMTLAALLGRRLVVLERYSGLYNLPRAACFDDDQPHKKNPTRGHQAGQEVGSSSQYSTAGVVSVRSCAFVISAPMLICASCVLSEAGALPANHEIEIKLNATNIRESANRFIGPPP